MQIKKSHINSSCNLYGTNCSTEECVSISVSTPGQQNDKYIQVSFLVSKYAIIIIIMKN